MSKITIGIRIHVSLEDISSLLNAASMGSAYWCGNSNELGYESNTKQILGGEKDYILFDDEEDHVSHFLNLKKVKRGLTVMAKKEPRHFADFIKQDYDQIAADIFLQCCLFGEVIYL